MLEAGGKINRIKSLDSLRGIAAIVVVLYHSVYTINLGSFSQPNSLIYVLEKILLFPAKFGESAVYLFMALSGYVLTFAYQKYEFDRFSNWLIWRSLRLLPVFYISLLVSSLISFLLFKKFQVTTPQLLHYYLFSNSTIYSGPNPPLWSLSVEIILSFLILLIIKFSRIIGRKYPIYLYLYLMSYLIHGWGARALFRSAIFFSIGISIYMGLRLTTLLKIILATGTLIFFIVGVFESVISRQAMTLLQLVAIPSILYFFLKRPLSSRITMFLGKISFSIYVWHWPILIMIRELLSNTNLNFPFNKLLIAIVSLLLINLWASISYFFIELRIQKFARRYLPIRD